MEAKFTAGPWCLSRPVNGYVNVDARHARVPHSGLARVVWLMEEETRSPDKEANAHLIAAAPDLFSAVEPFAAIPEIMIRDHADHEIIWAFPEGGGLTAGDIRAARAALAKARGEKDAQS